MPKKNAKILYFVKGARVSDEARAEADELDGDVMFRNAALVGSEKPEQCDFVAGEIPKAYADVKKAPKKGSKAAKDAKSEDGKPKPDADKGEGWGGNK